MNTPEEQAILDDIGGILSAGGSEITIVPEIQRQKFAKNFWNVAFSSYATLTRCVSSANLKLSPLTERGQVHRSGSIPTPTFRPPGLLQTLRLPCNRPGYRTVYRSCSSGGDARADLLGYVLDLRLLNLSMFLMPFGPLARALGYPDDKDGIPSLLPDLVIERTRAIHVQPNSSHKPSMALDAERGQPLEVEVILGEVVRMARDVGIDVPVSIHQLYNHGSRADEPVQRIEIMYGLLLVVQNQILGQRLA